MIHPYEHVGANPKIRYENEKGEAQTFSRLENLVEGLNLTTVGSLRDLFTNLSPGLNALIKRWKRGVYRTSHRVSEPPIRDLRGPVVGTIATVQTFLTPAQVDQIVDDYLAGATVTDLAVKYEVHRV
ncbi:hypothetical protein [Leucobacter sp. W1038]|uniref:hypothetical protein n=1 Tax=Leucobacter sp. W1038 TaxID=3438281 RepID=UPI003D9684D7